MPMRLLTSVLVLFALAAAPEQRPDFSGRWTLEAAPGDAGSGWGSPLTIAQAADALRVEYVFFAVYDLQPPLTFTFALDGRESVNRVMMGRGLQDERSTTMWDGETLVITTLHAFTNPASGTLESFEVKRRLTLEGPDTLIIDTARGGALGGPPSSTRVVYKRAG